MVFGWLFRSRDVVEEPDSVWVDKDQKDVGILNQIREWIRVDQAVFAVAHFQDSHDRLIRVLDKASVPHRPFDPSLLRLIRNRRPSAENEVWTVLCDQLQQGLAKAMERYKGPRVGMVVVEHSPTTEGDNRIRSFTNSLPFKGRMAFHSALDGPLCQTFCSEGNLTLLMKNLGAANRIQHKMLNGSFLKAQKRVEKKAQSNPARSAEQWFECNFPP